MGDTLMKMINGHEALALFQAMATLSAMALAGWFRKDSPEEDEVIALAHDLVIESICDADATNIVEAQTGENWREQLTVEELEEIVEDRDLRRFQNRN